MHEISSWWGAAAPRTRIPLYSREDYHYQHPPQLNTLKDFSKITRLHSLHTIEQPLEGTEASHRHDGLQPPLQVLHRRRQVLVCPSTPPTPPLPPALRSFHLLTVTLTHQRRAHRQGHQDRRQVGRLPRDARPGEGPRRRRYPLPARCHRHLAELQADGRPAGRQRLPLPRGRPLQRRPDVPGRQAARIRLHGVAEPWLRRQEPAHSRSRGPHR